MPNAGAVILCPKITADSDCSHEIKRCLLLRRKVMTIFKSIDIILPTKVHLVKAMIHFELIFVCDVNRSLNSIRYPVVAEPFVEKTVLFFKPMNYFLIFNTRNILY